MIIALGTESEWKIKYTKEVLQEIGIKADLKFINADSGVSDQPIGETEVITGSKNRAKFTWSNLVNINLALGVEIGYDLDDQEKYHMFCAAAGITEKNNLTALSSKLLLPVFFQNVLFERKYVGDYVREFQNMHDDLPNSYLAKIIRFREPFIKEAVRNVLLSSI